MKPSTAGGILTLWLVLLADGHASGDQTATDVNIVTGLDISNSIGPNTITLELVGMAQAIRDPRILQAIQAGEHQCIGFAVFAWHHGRFPVVVPWPIIDSAEDAHGAARLIEARQLVNVKVATRWNGISAG